MCWVSLYFVNTNGLSKIQLSFEVEQDLVIDRSTQPTVLLCGGEDAASRGTSAGQDAPPTQMGIV